MSNKETFTVRNVRAWLESLPEEWQDAPFMAVMHGMPSRPKRIIAYRTNGGFIGVAVNSIGTHLPVDGSLEWVHTLS